jgi:hypothetical protein
MCREPSWNDIYVVPSTQAVPTQESGTATRPSGVLVRISRKLAAAKHLFGQSSNVSSRNSR